MTFPPAQPTATAGPSVVTVSRLPATDELTAAEAGAAANRRNAVATARIAAERVAAERDVPAMTLSGKIGASPARPYLDRVT